MTRSLLLKGLAGVAAVGGAAGGLAVYGKEIFGGWGKAPEEPKSKDVSNFTQKELIDKVGLNCGLSGDDIGEETKECSVKDNGSINVKKREQEEEGVTFTGNGSTKLKVSKSEESGADGTDKYTKKLKFVVDSGDISLTKKDGGGTATTIPKLEQFETYEIFLKSDGKFYLRRKTEAKEEKIKALGLPSGCTLPESGDSNCSLDAEEIKKVNFDGQNGGVTVSSGTVSLKVTKMGDSDTDFGDDKYRFTFTFPGDQTINTKSLKGNIPYDFKIKKGSGNTLTLEQAWTDNNVFTKKAGLDCANQSECSVASDPKLNVKVGESKKEGISNKSGTGKIKMETDQAGYNQGLKFTITTADVSLTDGTGDAQVTKLEELETYEITEEGGKYYLTRKTSKDESIKSSLVLPQGCNLPTDAEVQCNLSPDDFKAINFDGKSGESFNGETMTLKISKATNTTDFPLGYKFTFNTTSEATISNEKKIKANIPTDFKIKKNEGKVSLEKAWDDTKFAEKVGLTCTAGSDGCCSKSSSSEQLNIKKGTDKKENITSFNGSNSGKIKVEKDQAGYNQGLKFTISGGSVTLTGGTKSSDSATDITQLDEYETYEIKEEGGKYYLTRKTGASETIESQLGLKEAGCSLSGTSSTCTLTSEKLQKINFNEKESGKPTISSGTATLTITSGADNTDFPLGYKFTLKSTTGDITIKATDNVVKKDISTDFKIKKDTSGQTTLSLEKAWNMTTLGKKVGLTCNNGSGNECTIEGNGNQLKVKQKGKYDSEVKSTTLSKATGSGGSSTGKIKVTKDQAGYNQGFKFKIEDGSIDLTGSTASDDTDKIHTLGEFETYEIKEESDKQWYLVRKDRADGFIKEQLGIKEFCSESEKFPHTNSQNTTCNFKTLEGLKKVKFAGENGNNISGTVDDSSNQVQLQIKKDTKLPGGFKFNFSGGQDVCLPDGAGGKVSLKDNNSGVDYKIKKKGSGDSVTLTLEKNNGGGNSCK